MNICLLYFHSYIKLSSSNINNVILIGAIVLYTSVLLVLIDSRIVQANKLPYMCSVSTLPYSMIVLFTVLVDQP